MKKDAMTFRQIPGEHVEFIYPGSPNSPAKKVHDSLSHLVPLHELAVFSNRSSQFPDSIDSVDVELSERRGAMNAQIHAVLEGAEEKGISLIVEGSHHRAASLPLPEPIVDVRNETYGGQKYHSRNAYNFLNIKGVGYIFPESYGDKKEGYHGRENQPTVVTKTTKEFNWGSQVLGMFDKRLFEDLRLTTEQLMRLGARVESIAGAAQISACYYEGKLQTIEELKEKGVIRREEYYGNEFEALEVFRLQRVPARIIDLYNADPEKKKQLLIEAFYYLNQENQALGKPQRYDINNQESIEEYLTESAYWVGRNLGIIQATGQMMKAMSSGNITLGTGELVDLDSVREINAKLHINAEQTPVIRKKTGEEWQYNIPPCFLKDIRDASNSLRRLINALREIFPVNIQTRQKMHQSFLKGYKKGREASSKLEKKNFKNLRMENLEQTVDDLGQKIIVERMNTHPITFTG